MLALISDKNLFKFHRNVILKMLLLYRKKKKIKRRISFFGCVGEVNCHLPNQKMDFFVNLKVLVLSTQKEMAMWNPRKDRGWLFAISTPHHLSSLLRFNISVNSKWEKKKKKAF